jgi:histidinol-phosphatase
MPTTREFDLDVLGGARALDALIDEVVRVGEHALVMHQQGAGNRFKSKPDRSPVTEADEWIETQLRAFCQQHFPQIGFVGEETGSDALASTVGQGTRWVVDPIDGTRGFIRGMDTWSVLVGLEYSGVPSIGIAFLPRQGNLLVGVAGQGARWNGRPAHVSKVERLQDAMVCHGGLQQFTDANLEHVLPLLATQSFTQRGLGDFANYQALIQGKADAVIDPSIQPWDICASYVLVHEAGGTMTDVHGRATIYSGVSVASNGLVHEELLTLLRAPVL